MSRRRATPRSGNYGGVKVRLTGDDNILHEEEWQRGCDWAGIALVAMFLFITAGAVVFGW